MAEQLLSVRGISSTLLLLGLVPMGLAGCGSGQAAKKSAPHDAYGSHWGSNKYPLTGRIEFATPTWDRDDHYYEPLKTWKCGKKHAMFQPGKPIAWVGRIPVGDRGTTLHLSIREANPGSAVIRTDSIAHAGRLVRGVLTPKVLRHNDMESGHFVARYSDKSKTVASGDFRVERAYSHFPGY